MERRKKKPAGPAWRRRTTLGRGTRASQQLADKRKANELASSGDSMETTNRRPAPDAESVTLPATSTVTDEQAAAGSRQPVSSGVVSTYAAVLAGHIAPSQSSRPLKPTAMDSDPSEPEQPIGACLATCPFL